VLYRVSSKTIEQINKYQCWLYRNGISAVQIAKIKGYFNIERLILVKPKARQFVGLVIMMWFILFVELFSFNFVVKPAALIKIDEKEPYFWIAKDYARNSEFSWRPFSNLNWSLTPTVCEERDFDIKKWAVNTKMSMDTGKMICEHFFSKESQKVVAQIIDKQRATFLPICGGLLIFLLICFIKLSKMLKTQDLRRQIKRHRTNKWKRQS